MINEIICDNILRKFEDKKSIPREKLCDKSFYENIDPDYLIVEEHINYLIRDRTLRELDSEIFLTTKGWFILTNADKVGYVARRIEAVQWEKSERDSTFMFRWIYAVAALAILSWFIYKFIIFR
ncbi:MAG: hypothetical protein WKF87_13865 [Chryseolinea sp.]